MSNDMDRALHELTKYIPYLPVVGPCYDLYSAYGYYCDGDIKMAADRMKTAGIGIAFDAIIIVGALSTGGTTLGMLTSAVAQKVFVFGLYQQMSRGTCY